MEMRELLVGTALLISALIITFAAASILQGIAMQKRSIVAEPFPADRITPAATAVRTPRSEPGHSVILASRRAEM